MKGVFQIFCIFNENLISHNVTRHVRQFKQDRDGNHYPLLKDGKSIIHAGDDGLYRVKTINDETIAISDDYDVAYRRAEYADSNASIQVKDRKSTRLNSSHVSISYAVFCLKKKT